MTSTHPTYEQLAALPAHTEQPVPVPFEDANGHLNVRHYTGIASEGLDESLVDLGIPQNWPAEGHACDPAKLLVDPAARRIDGELRWTPELAAPGVDSSP